MTIRDAAPGRRPGAFVVSLDFELHWGVRDVVPREDFAARADGARRAIPQLLERFVAHDVHATFGTVGFLFAEDRDEIVAVAPEPRPRYADETLSPYPALATGPADESRAPDQYAASLISLIAASPGQEVGSHTFSHCFCLEPGLTVAAFEADLLAARRIGHARGLDLQSLIFPRNQYGDEHLRVARRAGFGVVRSNAAGFLYEPMNEAALSTRIRALRLLDDYLPITGHNCAPLPTRPSDPELPLLVPASRFLRPCRRSLSALEGLRFRRIARSMTRAARRGELFHLWWHPHNFATEVEANFRMLDRILAHYDELHARYDMRSPNLAELASECETVAATPRPDPASRHVDPGRTDTGSDARVGRSVT